MAHPDRTELTIQVSVRDNSPGPIDIFLTATTAPEQAEAGDDRSRRYHSQLAFSVKELPHAADHIAEWKSFFQQRADPAQSKLSEYLKQAGLSLYNALFPDLMSADMGDQQYHRLAEKAKHAGPLRIWLNVSSDLDLIPWELIWCPVLTDWMSTITQRAVVRTITQKHSERQQTIEHLKLPLRIVTVMAEPSDAEPIYIRKHRELLDECHKLLQNGDHDVKIEHFDNSKSFDNLRSRMESAEPIHVLHIYCHGDISGDEAEFLFAGDTNDANDVMRHTVSSISLRRLIRQRSIQAHEQQIQLVVLNVCYSGTTRMPGILRNFAAELMKDGVPAVIAMQGRVSTEIVNKLTKKLYNSLWDGNTIEQSLTKVRNDLFNDYKNTLEWAIPVLYMQPSATNLRLCNYELPRWEEDEKIGISRLDFLESHGLGAREKNEKFFSTRAETVELDRQIETFVVGPLYCEGRADLHRNSPETIISDLLDLQNSFVFAQEGHGKSSYRLFMENYNHNGRVPPLIVVFRISHDLSRPRRMTVENYVRHIKRIVYSALQRNIEAQPTRIVDLDKDRIASGHFQELALEYSRSRRRSTITDEAYWLEYLSRIAEKANYSGICFVVEDAKNPELLEPLIFLASQNRQGFAFKFFLPLHIQDQLREINNAADNTRVYRIGAWSNKQLKQFLGKWFSYYYRQSSKDPPRYREPFGALCDKTVGDDIDGRIIKAANGSPRKLIEIIRDIIDAHCRTARSPGAFISRDAVETVMRRHER